MRHAATLLLALILTTPASARPRTLVLDPADARVTFLLVATGHDVEGTFDLERATVEFDDESGAASGEIVFSATSATTGHRKRDKTMHAKVLRSAANPTISFVPERVEGRLEDGVETEIRLHGTVTLIGREHPLTLPVRVSPKADALHVESVFAVPYVDWGLKDPSLMFLRVAKSVEVTVEADGHVTNATRRTAR